MNQIKKKIVTVLLLLTIVAPLINISYGIYFGVLTNVLINTFWNSGFTEKVNKKKINKIKTPYQ